jgi:hypothetical protein
LDDIEDAVAAQKAVKLPAQPPAKKATPGKKDQKKSRGE